MQLQVMRSYQNNFQMTKNLRSPFDKALSSRSVIFVKMNLRIDHISWRKGSTKYVLFLLKIVLRIDHFHLLTSVDWFIKKKPRIE